MNAPKRPPRSWIDFAARFGVSESDLQRAMQEAVAEIKREILDDLERRKLPAPDE